MVDIVSTVNTSPLRITVRPNSVLHRGEDVLTLALTAPVGAATATAFVVLGAWPVVPFVVLALAGLGLAVYLVRRHAGDFERIVVDDDKLTVDKHAPDGDQHFEFNGYWVQLIQQETAAGGCSYLALRSHGREVALGHDLTDDERESVGRLLRARLVGLRHATP